MWLDNGHSSIDTYPGWSEKFSNTSLFRISCPFELRSFVKGQQSLDNEPGALRPSLFAGIQFIFSSWVCCRWVWSIRLIIIILLIVWIFFSGTNPLLTINGILPLGGDGILFTEETCDVACYSKSIMDFHDNGNGFRWFEMLYQKYGLENGRIHFLGWPQGVTEKRKIMEQRWSRLRIKTSSWTSPEILQTSCKSRYTFVNKWWKWKTIRNIFQFRHTHNQMMWERTLM